jgi:hypothetical protein
MGHRAQILSIVFVLACAAAARVAPAAVLSAGQVLEVRFVVPPLSSPTPDTLTINLGVVQVLAAHTSRAGALFDGNTLLGTGSTSSFGGHVGALSLSPARSWRSPTSVWDFDNPAVADFTSIANGSITGRIEFAIATGAMDITLSNVSLRMGQATAPNIFTNSNVQPLITSVQIIPEPATLAGCGALLALAARLPRGRGRACDLN